MKLYTYALLVVVLLFSSCSVVQKNGYYQSRNYKSGKHFVKQNKIKNNIRFKDAGNDFLDLEKQSVIKTVVAKHLCLNTENDQKNERENKPRDLEKDVTYSSANHKTKTDTKTSKKQRSQRSKTTHGSQELTIKNLVSKHIHPHNKQRSAEQQEGNEIYAKLALVSLTLGVVLLFVFLAGVETIAFLVLMSLVGLSFVVFGALNFWVNKDVPKEKRSRMIRIANWIFLLGVGIPAALFLFAIGFITFGGW